MMKPTIRGRGEMADALVLGTSGAIRKGSTPFVPTTIAQHFVLRFLFAEQVESDCKLDLLVFSYVIHIDLI
ncbi:MAG: hypothetical protein RI985_1356 [Chloroflexota bacterium]|jgi:hypothetical protein